jgi:hypothetical protein
MALSPMNRARLEPDLSKWTQQMYWKLVALKSNPEIQ